MIDLPVAEQKTAMLPRAKAILEHLVAQESVAGNDAAVEDCLAYLAETISPAAASVELERYGGPPVLLARFGDTDEPRRFVFSGHVDVVPASPAWGDAFTLRERDGVLAGRGVVDMKGAVAAFVAALEALGRSGALEGCSVELALTGDEEVGSAHGTIPLVESGVLSAASGVCGEATRFRVSVASRGVVWVRISIFGKGGHAGFSHQIDNPSDCAAQLLLALRELPLAARDDRFSPATPSLTVSRSAPLDGLEAPNVVPDAVGLMVDRRLLPDESAESAIDQIAECVRATVTAPYSHEIEVLRRWPPYAIAADEPIARSAGSALEATGLPFIQEADLAANDSSWLVQAGIPTILLGPGDPEQSHATGESLSLDDLATACAVYAQLILRSADPL
jgi:acetylornithine deacetylase/succinyl-diaminopimelate desuccinylase-like protein